jgi:hypothetical protein
MKNQVDYPALPVIAEALYEDGIVPHAWLGSLKVAQALDDRGYLILRNERYYKSRSLAFQFGLGCGGTLALFFCGLVFLVR